MGADDRHRARPDDHVLQCRFAAGRDGRHGAELRRSANHGRDRNRGLLDAGCRLRDAWRETRPAVRRGAGLPRRRRLVLRLADPDDVQPQRHHDDSGPSAWRHGRGCDRAVAGGADRRELHRAPAGDCRGRAWLRACRRRRAGIYHWRRSRHLHRLAAGVRNSDRGFRDRFLPELPSQGRPWTARRADRHSRRCAGGVGDHPHQFRLQQSERLGSVAGKAQCAVQSPRPIAGAGHDRAGYRARPGLPDVDAPPPGRRKDAAACTRSDQLARRNVPRSMRCLSSSHWRPHSISRCRCTSRSYRGARLSRRRLR